MKIYIVEISTGEWSNAHTRVVSVFDSREAAELEVSNIDTYYKRISENEPPYSQDDYIEDRLTEEQDREFSTWNSTKYDADSYKGCYIIELDLNEHDITYKQQRISYE